MSPDGGRGGRRALSLGTVTQADAESHSRTLLRGRRSHHYLRRGKLVLLGVLVFVAAASSAYFLLPALGSVSGEDLFYSVTDEVGGTIPQVSPCTRVDEKVRRCRISDRGVSGVAIYRVALDGNCWTASKRESYEEDPLPAHARGCVDLDDQLRIGNRLADLLGLQ